MSIGARSAVRRSSRVGVGGQLPPRRAVGDQVADDVLRHRGQQIALVGEVDVEGRARDSAGRDDRLDAEVGVAAPGLDQLLDHPDEMATEHAAALRVGELQRIRRGGVHDPECTARPARSYRAVLMLKHCV